MSSGQGQARRAGCCCSRAECCERGSWHGVTRMQVYHHRCVSKTRCAGAMHACAAAFLPVCCSPSLALRGPVAHQRQALRHVRVG